MSYLDFEQPILELEGKIAELRRMDDPQLDLRDELKRLEDKVERLLRQTYTRLTPWQKVQVARHPSRPRFIKVAAALFPDFTPLAGDRCFGEDAAIIGGLATFEGYTVMVLGQERGHDLQSRLQHNFGMAKPEGYRKAIRLMDLANRAGMPILTLIDTPGAYPGIETEERGQAQAIAESIQFMFTLKVPVVAVVIGEGGSGGALALGVANRVLMQEYSTYSVISPEGCASILWSDATLAERASDKLKMGPTDLMKAGVIDGTIPEPKGGAHRDWAEAARNLRKTVDAHFAELAKMSPKELQADRLKKFRAMGANAIAKTSGADAR